VGLVLAALPWQSVERELAGDLLEHFEWLRAGIPSSRRREHVAGNTAAVVDWRLAAFALAVSFGFFLAAARVFS
jgi:hypothetical protein